MKYTEVVDELTGQHHIILDLGDGAFKSFPADPENPEYAAWAIAEGIMEAPVVETEPEAEPVATETEITEPVTEPVTETVNLGE